MEAVVGTAAFTASEQSRAARFRCTEPWRWAAASPLLARTMQVQAVVAQVAGVLAELAACKLRSCRAEGDERRLQAADVPEAAAQLGQLLALARAATERVLGAGGTAAEAARAAVEAGERAGFSKDMAEFVHIGG